MPNSVPPPRCQRGIALVTALILLLVVTLLGLSSVRLITQQERIVQYSYDRGLAFQAAEAALREAEASLEELKPTPAPGACILEQSGVHRVQVCPPPTSAIPRWTDASFTEWADGAVVGTSTLAVTPQYFAEFLGASFPCDADPVTPQNCKRYRITARAGGSGRAQAMVQSVYATD